LNFLIDTLRQRAELDALKSTRSFSFVGEVVRKTFLQKLYTAMPKATVGKETEYGLAEVPRITRWCPLLAEKYKRKNMEFQVFHFFNEKHCSVSITHPDEEGRGEITVTTQTLKNYKTGDSGTLFNEPCSCGAKKTLIVYGRENYDIVRCVGATILLREVDYAFGLLKEYVADYYVEIEEVDDGIQTLGKLTFFLVPTKKLLLNKNSEAFIITRLGNTIVVTPTQKLEDMVRGGHFLYPSVKFVESISWRGAKKVRLRKIS